MSYLSRNYRQRRMLRDSDANCYANGGRLSFDFAVRGALSLRAYVRRIILGARKR
jgi:hypothetical protein